MLNRPVSHYMSSPVFAIAADADLETARTRLEQHHVSSLLVQDGDHHLAGVISRTDLLRAGEVSLEPEHGALQLRLPTQHVRDAAHMEVVTVEPNASVRDAARMLVEHGVHRVYVASHEHGYGVLSTRDVMRALVDSRVSARVSQLMTSPVQTLNASDPVDAAVDRLREAKVTGLVVVDAAGWPVGLFTQHEALESKGYFSADPVERVMSSRLITVRESVALHHAAAQAVATRARHVLILDDRHKLSGILSGLDFAQAAADWVPA